MKNKEISVETQTKISIELMNMALRLTDLYMMLNGVDIDKMKTEFREKCKEKEDDFKNGNHDFIFEYVSELDKIRSFIQK